MPTDDQFMGDILPTKQRNSIRLYYNNINGINYNNRFESLHPTLDNMNNLEADIICFTEPNLDTTQAKIRLDLHKTIQRHCPQSKVLSTTSPLTFHTAFKPGGCLTIIRNTIHSRVNLHGSDELGRWQYARLATRSNAMIYIVTIYKPCKHSLKQAGPMTVFRQHWTILRGQGQQNPKPRQQFDDDLITFLSKITQDGNQIILVGDFNDIKNNSKLFPRLYSIGLRDMINDRHSNLPPFRSYLRGSNTIDYAMCSLSILRHIESSTYEPFKLHTNSDHRGIIIDFSKSLLGQQDRMTPIPHRGVQSTNPFLVEQFLKTLKHQWLLFDIPNRINNLLSQQPSRKTLRSELNSIDNDVTKAMLIAERKTKRKQQPPWSPKLKAASLHVRLYKLFLKEFQTGNSYTNAIEFTQNLLRPTSIERPTTIQDCQRQLRRLQKQLKKLRRKAHKERKSYLDQLIQQYEITGDNEKQSIVRKIQRAEATKRCYNKLRYILNPPKPGVTFIQHTKNGRTKTVYNRLQLEDMILHRNQRHFNQCAGTPFTTGQLRQLNWSADSPLADAILQGTDPTTHANPYVHTVLQNCNQQTKTLPISLSNDDLCNLFKVWNESTTTSPSGRHLGLYKSIFLNQQDEDVIKIQHQLTSIIKTSLEHGIGLNRWRRVLNVMVHKLEGSFLLDKLRVIHLFEADYNGTIGLLFNRKLLYNAEIHNVLNNNQWGTRPHRQAEDVLMLKELSYNLASTTRTTLATFDNDATGCFDRVPCSIAMLASRRLGATKEMCRLQADTLKNIQHSLRTAFGPSIHSYTSTDSIEIHGQGQGSRAGPPTWVFVSSLLLDCMEKLATGVHFTCPYQQVHHRRHNNAFVDDVTGYTNCFVDELHGCHKVDKTLTLMQKDATIWNELLQVSGGKLALHKCLYYVVSWQWSNGFATPQPAEQIVPKIKLLQGSQEQTINHYECNQAHRTLGQMKAPNGSQEAQLKFLTTKSNKWLEAIKEAQLSRLEAKAAYESIWLPSMTYGSGTTNLTEKDLNGIQQPIVNHILPLLGYNRHFPRIAVYGTRKYGGMQLKHLYTEQGIAHVTQFVKYFRSNNSIGKLLHVSLRWIRLISGLSRCPLRIPQPHYHHIQDRWFSTLILFLYQCNASIETTDDTNILCRHDDSCLIDDILLLAPTKLSLILFNQCRLYLHVTTLSDITNAKGTCILRHVWTGTQPIDSPILWPQQAKPSSKAWRLWRSYLAQCYLLDDTITTPTRSDLSLRSPLGNWNQTHHHTQLHQHYINPSTLQLYKRQPTGFVIFSPCRNNRRNIHYKPTRHTTYVPLSSHPITISTDRDNLSVNKHDIQTPPVVPCSTTHSLQTSISNLSDWELNLIQHHRLYVDEDTIATCIDQATTLATDGSHKDSRGSYGWILASPDGTHLAEGSGTVYGATLTSFRCEAYGILSALRFLLLIRQHYHQPISRSSITWWCDSQSLLQRLTSLPIPNPNRAKLSDHDVETTIRHTIPLVTTNLQSHHIRSHQYDNDPINSIPLPYRLNRLADRLATKHLHQINGNTTHAPLLAPARCQVNIHGKTITRGIPNNLRSAFFDKPLQDHLLRRLGISIHQDINWNCFSSAFLQLPQRHQQTIRKWVFGFLPTQRRLHRYSECPSPLCPKCKTTPETDYHFLTCGGADSWSEYLFQPLEALQRQHNITHWVYHTIYNNLRRFLNQTPPQCLNNWIADAYEHQTNIGWNACFYGALSPAWSQSQHRAQPTRHAGDRICTKIVSLLFKAVIRRWQDRNSQLHKTSPNNEIRLRLEAKVRGLYSCSDKTLESDKAIFSMPLTELLQKPTQQLQLFILHNTPIVKTSVRQQQELTSRQHRDIASYFQRLPHN